ncbi:MAG: hypothetical protein HY861_05195 [Chlamydiia bacterium]|nr:hypothetical protein [Chlamydiia bacterium]
MPLKYECQWGGRVLLIRRAVYNSKTGNWHDIRIVRNGLGFLWGGKFQISDAIIEQVRATYGILLKTVRAEPGSMTLDSVYTGTEVAVQSLHTMSYPYKKGGSDDDTLLAAKDATSIRPEIGSMTVHDAVVYGILMPLGIQGAVGSAPPGSGSSDGETPLQFIEPPQSIVPSSHASAKPVLIELPPIPCYKAESTPQEPGYDDASFGERRRRMIQHLDRSGPVPFSAFVDRNEHGQIDPVLFQRMESALTHLAADPAAGGRDEKYMRELMEHWFRAAYHYLDKNSVPGDGFARILAEVLGSLKQADTPKVKEKAHIRAKEIYWRQQATIFWMTFIQIFACNRIDIEALHRQLSQKTSLKRGYFS